MGEVDSETGSIETREMDAKDVQESQEGVPQEVATLNTVIDQGQDEAVPEASTEDSTEDLKEELKDNIQEERDELNDVKQRLDEQRQWDQPVSVASATTM